MIGCSAISTSTGIKETERLGISAGIRVAEELAPVLAAYRPGDGDQANQFATIRRHSHGN